jgi:molecular chaperone GrpE
MEEKVMPEEKSSKSKIVVDLKSSDRARAEVKKESKKNPEKKTKKKTKTKKKKSGKTASRSLELEKIKGESKENYSKYLRALADLANYRKRMRKEITEVHQIAKEGLIQDILPVLDNFNRAINSDHFSKNDNFHKGVEMIYYQLMGVLAEEGLKEVNAEGETFDPALHEAIETEITEEYPSDTVIKEFEPGYMFGEKLIRPVKVKVAKNPEKTETKDTEN